MFIYIYIYIYTHAHTHAHAQTDTHTHTHSTHTNAHTHTHTHTHTNIEWIYCAVTEDPQSSALNPLMKSGSKNMPHTNTNSKSDKMPEYTYSKQC